MACPQRCRYPKRQEATVRCASRLYQLGIGRKYTGEAIRMVITEHCIDASRNCQNLIGRKASYPLHTGETGASEKEYRDASLSTMFVRHDCPPRRD